MKTENKIQFYSTWSEKSNILNCVISYSGINGDVYIHVEQNQIKVEGRKTTKQFIFKDLNLHPDTCRGLSCLPSREIHFSLKAEPQSPDKNVVNGTYSISHVTPCQISLSQNDVVEKIQLLQNRWYCSTCQQKLLADRCILTRVLPLPSENWSDYADMWFCHKPEGGEPVRKQKFLPKSGECFVGETYLLVNGKQVKIGAINVSKNGSLTCCRCGKQLGVLVETEDTSIGGVYKLFLHTVRIQNITLDSTMTEPSINSDQAELFFSRFLLEQSQLYTSFRFIVETSAMNGYKGDTVSSTMSTCLVWLLDTDVAVFKSTDDTKSENVLQKHNIIKILFKCQLSPSDPKNRPTDYVTKSLISMWRKDNTVHGFTLPHPVFLQFVDVLVQNCKKLSQSHRYLNGFHVTYISKDHTTVK